MDSRAKTTFLFAAAFIALLSAVPGAASAAGRDPFGKGSMRLCLLAGNGSAFDQTYVVAGAGVGYFAADDIEIGLDAESWSGASPRIGTLSPQVRYVFPAEGTVHPYAGLFYCRTLIEGHRDLDSGGARAGLYFLSGSGGYFGAGIVYERYASCNETIYRSCRTAYPELSLAFVF